MLTMPRVADELKDNGMSQICPGMFVSGVDPARDIPFLKDNHITAVISVTEFCCACDYAHMDIAHLHLWAMDHAKFPIDQYFDLVYDFAKHGRGNILIHCYAGRSRSITLAMSILIRTVYERDLQNVKRVLQMHPTKNHAYITQLVYQYVQRKRRVALPNPGFLKQLVHLEFKLRKWFKLV